MFLNFNKAFHPITLAIIFCLVLHSFFYFKGCSNGSLRPTPVTINPVAIRDSLVVNETGYNRRIDSLTETGNELTATLSSTQNALATIKKKNQALQARVYILLDKPYTSTVDSLSISRDCEELKMQVDTLLNTDHQKDSLYEAVASNLTLQVTLKDSVISTQNEKYCFTRSLLDTSLDQQTVLLVENAVLYKQLKRQKKNHRLLSGGLAIVATIATIFLMK